MEDQLAVPGDGGRSHTLGDAELTKTTNLMTRRKLILASFALIAVVAIAAPVGLRLWQLLSYARQRTIGAELIESLRHRRPEAVSIQTWENATGWAITAYHNVCFSEDHVTFDELVRFNRDAEIELAGHVDLHSIDWVWARLAKTGPHGQKYVDKFEPEYRSLVYGASSHDISL